MATMDAVKDFLFAKPVDDAHPLSCNATVLGLALLYAIAFHVTYLTRWTEPKGYDKFIEHPRAEWHNSLGSAFSAVLVVAGAPHLDLRTMPWQGLDACFVRLWRYHVLLWRAVNNRRSLAEVSTAARSY
jgi:hypothetical protein